MDEQDRPYPLGLMIGILAAFVIFGIVLGVTQ